MRILAVLVVLLAPQASLAQSCPQPLAAAHRLVLVVADQMTSATARVQRFARTAPEAAWKPVGGAASALMGHRGIGWAQAFRKLARAGEPVKVEGDKRTPAGFFGLGGTFGFAASPRPGYFRIADGTTCVNDVSSRAYNTITTRAKIGWSVRGENMWRVPAYRSGLFIEYPSDAKMRAGSCIFIHLWLPRMTGTAGCVAVKEPEIAALQDFAKDGAVLAVLPRQAVDRLHGCLPDSRKR